MNYRVAWFDHGEFCETHCTEQALPDVLRIAHQIDPIVEVEKVDRELDGYELGLVRVFRQLAHPCRLLSGRDEEWLAEVGIQP